MGENLTRNLREGPCTLNILKKLVLFKKFVIGKKKKKMHLDIKNKFKVTKELIKSQHGCSQQCKCHHLHANQ